ncbi:MAG: Endolytic murein transglycosylase [Candidatus Peribacteria bacterium]|nr:Endolytic murein transglycosylase [Candidatus Peribacteria bacterium]
MIKRIFIVIGIVLVLWLGNIMLQRNALKPVDALNTKTVVVTIPDGASVKMIAGILQADGVIRSASAFRRLATHEQLTGKLLAGTFLLQPSMTAQEVLKALTAVEGGQQSVTIPEGYTVKNIDALLAEKGFTQSGDIERCARTCDFSAFTFLPQQNNLAGRGGKVEGYLFPDTYFVSSADFTPESFLQRLLSTFQKKVVEAKSTDIRSSGKSLHDIMTMASLVEEETRAKSERPVVAGILWKRLREGMRLDVDAAVRYFLEKPGSDITRADLETDSPYNLRKTKGLPPGPIANPSLASVNAALHPEESSYYYYLHDANGNVHYAATNDEHNANRAKYLP